MCSIQNKEQTIKPGMVVCVYNPSHLGDRGRRIVSLRPSAAKKKRREERRKGRRWGERKQRREGEERGRGREEGRKEEKKEKQIITYIPKVCSHNSANF
jgi:hypothetical protein